MAWRVKEKFPPEMNRRRAQEEEEVERNVMILDLSLDVVSIIV